ncbi:30S ribosomal protein S13 [Candidatus Micrarchaeota archaeon]|nr:30S ribosomal protein S13 [Candidatus Micrarchaeota archaeon]
MAKKPEKKPIAKKPEKEEEQFRGIVRIAGKDVKGEISLLRALRAVRGIGHTMAVSAASIIKRDLSLDPNGRVGDLTEAQIESIDKLLYSLQDHGVPVYLMNRCSDFNSGVNRHIIMNDLLFETTQDVEREKKAYSWKGYRHTYGQKVRGQRTRNTGRTGMAVGVLRKAIIAAQGGAVAGAKPGAPAAAAAPAAAGKPAAGAKPAAAVSPARAAAAKAAAPAAKAEKK